MWLFCINYDRVMDKMRSGCPDAYTICTVKPMTFALHHVL